jgi:hypothetical protein
MPHSAKSITTKATWQRKLLNPNDPPAPVTPQQRRDILNFGDRSHATPYGWTTRVVKRNGRWVQIYD